MLQKLYTPGLTLMIVAGLAIGITISAVQEVRKHSPDDHELEIGMTMSAVQPDEELGGKYGVEDRGETIQAAQVNANQIADKYSMEIDPAAEQQLGEQTFNELKMFFHTAEKAIEAKDLEALMALYSDNYRDGDIDKKSVAQAWQKIFARMDTMASLQNMKLAKMSADGSMVVLQGNGLLLGVAEPGKGLITIDNWNNQDHILLKEDGKWKLIAIYGLERQRLWFDKPMHPLF